MAGIKFDITADNANFISKLQEIEKGVNVASKQIETMFSSIVKSSDSGAASIETLRQYIGSLGDACSENEAAINSLNTEYERLGKQAGKAFMSGNDSEYRSLKEQQSVLAAEIALRESLQNEMQNYSSKLEDEAQHLENEKQSLEDVGNAHVSLRTRLRELREALVDMEAAGERGSDAYKAIQEEAAKLTDALADAQTQATILAHDQRGMQGLISGLSGVTGAFSAAQGAAALFSDKNEDLQKTMLKVQSAMSIVQGLQQVQQTLNKDSAFMLVTMNSLKEWWTKIVTQATASETAETAAINANTTAQTGNAAATSANTAATSAGTVANWSLAASFKAIGLAIKSIPVFGWITAAIGGLVAIMSSLIAKQKEAKRAQDELFSSIADNVYKPVSAIEQLSMIWSKLGDNVEEQNKFIEESQGVFEQCGVSVKNLADAQNLLVDNKDAFIQAQIEKAKATIYLQQATDKVKELVKAEQEYESMSDTKRTYVGSVGGGMFGYGGQWVEVQNTAKGKKQEEIEKLKKEIQSGWENAAEANEKAAGIYEEAAIRNADEVAEGSIAAIEKAIQKRNQELRKVAIDSDEYKRISKEIGELQKLLPSSSKESTQTENKRLEQQEKLSEQLLSLQRQNQQDEIDLMEDGTEKKLKQIALEYDKQIAEIKKKEKEWRDAQGGGLTDEQSVQISIAYTQAKEKRDNEVSSFTQKQIEAERQAMNEYLKEYGDYMEKRQAITELYNDKIAKAATEGEKLSLGEQMKRELAGVDDEAQKKTSIITKLFDDMSKKSVADMRAIADEAEKMLSYLNSGEYSVDENGVGLFGLTKEQFDILSESPEKLESIKNEIENVRKAADEGETALNKVANGLKSVFSSGNDASKVKKALSDIQEGLNEVLQVGRFLSDTLSTLGDSFGSGALSGIADGLNVAMDSVNSAMQGASVAASLGLGGIGAAAGAAIGLVTSLASSIAKIHDSKNEKRIERLQDQIDLLNKSYEKLGNSIEEAYSKDASALIEDQNKSLEQQKILIQQQINEEKNKKHTDNDRIKEWQQQIEDIDSLIEENKEKAVDAIFGEDLQSAIENFADAYAEAWASGEDRATSAKDTVKKMMQQMVQESINAAIQSSGAMEEIRQKLQEFYTDNVLSSWEQDYIYKMAEELQEKLDKKFGWADSLMGGSSSTSQTASSKGFEAMSQDTAEELNGRFTALQISSEEIKNQMIAAVVGVNTLVSISTDGNVILGNILTQHVLTNSYLEDMVKYSKTIVGFGGKLDKIVEQTK